MDSFKIKFAKILMPYSLVHFKCFPGGSDGKESACSAGDRGLIPRPGRSPGEGNGNPLRILAWEIPWMEEGSQRAGHD